MAAKKRLGVGLIGGGFIGRFHIRSWVGVRDADLLGIVDLDRETAEEAATLAKSLDVGEMVTRTMVVRVDTGLPDGTLINNAQYGASSEELTRPVMGVPV